MSFLLFYYIYYKLGVTHILYLDNSNMRTLSVSAEMGQKITE